MKKENKTITSNCHSCVSENPSKNKALYTAGSSGRAHACPGMTESGRSMVEMLGVLAIIGVLSVAGIAGYTAAMNKHRANELMNGVSMRLMTLAAQRARGIQNLSLAEFGDNKVGTSTISVDTSKTDAIVLTLSDVPVAVCQNMFNTKGANVVEMTSNGVTLTSASGCVDGKPVTVTFNNDLSVSNGNSRDVFPDIHRAGESCVTENEKACHPSDGTLICYEGEWSSFGPPDETECNCTPNTCNNTTGQFCSNNKYWSIAASSKCKQCSDNSWVLKNEDCPECIEGSVLCVREVPPVRDGKIVNDNDMSFSLCVDGHWTDEAQYVNSLTVSSCPFGSECTTDDSVCDPNRGPYENAYECVNGYWSSIPSYCYE